MFEYEFRQVQSDSDLICDEYFYQERILLIWRSRLKKLLLAAAAYKDFVDGYVKDSFDMIVYTINTETRSHKTHSRSELYRKILGENSENF